MLTVFSRCGSSCPGVAVSCRSVSVGTVPCTLDGDGSGPGVVELLLGEGFNIA